jgi:rod shape-determining protein MreD
VRTFYLILSILVCLLLQATLAPRIAFGDIQPDFIVIVVLLFALYRGAVPGAILGFAVGFLQDLGNPVMLGLNALTKTLMGFAIGRVGEKTFPDNVPFLFGLFAAASLGHDTVYLLFYKWPHLGSAVVMIVVAALPSALYTAFFGVLIDRVFTLWGAKAVLVGKKRQH